MIFNFFDSKENLVDTFKKKVCGACEKFRDIKELPGKFFHSNF